MRPWQLYYRTAVLAILLTILVFFIEHSVPSAELINLRGRDLFFRLRHTLSSLPSAAHDIVLVVLDDETLNRLERRWSYPRSLYAVALRTLKPYRPKAVGFDLIFSGKDYSPESDQDFASALAEAGNVVVATHESQEGEVGPLSLISEHAWRVGIVDKPRDTDRAIRRAYLSWPAGRENRRSWELELFAKAFSEVKAQKMPLATSLIINYLMSFNDFQKVSFWRLLEQKVRADEIRDKIILVGLTAEAFHDIHVTPLGAIPGVAVNANVILMLMTGTFFSFVPLGYAALLSFLSFWLVLLIAFSSSAVVGLLLVGLMILLFLGVSFLLFSVNVILDIWLIAFGITFIFVGAILYRQGQLFFENVRLQEESARDPLTGFYNRRFLTLKLKSEFNYLITRRGWSKPGYEISVVMLDLDNFKLVNDRFGHAEGDRVLRTMGHAIRSSVRKRELICRYGGDEFCIILPSTTIEDAARFAEKVRTVIENDPDLKYRTSDADGADTIQVTASIGVASVLSSKAFDSGKLLKAADCALYRAKSAGRNRVCIFDPAHDVISQRSVR